jgi:hypothetical protein
MALTRTSQYSTRKILGSSGIASDKSCHLYEGKHFLQLNISRYFASLVLIYIDYLDRRKSPGQTYWCSLSKF